MVLRRFTMPFEPMTIEHLGLRLYSTLPPVISELVANAYDADSPKVEVMLPAGPIRQASEVIVRDYGHGLDEDDIQNEYLPIGRNRRGEDLSQLESKSGRRRVTGRKGLGKLSGLGVAKQIQLRSIKDGIATCILIDYDKMKQWSKEKRTDYEPGHILDLSGTTDEPDGVEVTLRQLRRKNAISADVVRRGLARRLAFIGRSFEVVVNGQPIGPGDRLTRKECAKGLSWDVADIPDKTAKGLHLDGWIGFLERSSQIDRGVDIFATEKAVELGSFFNYKSTHAQFARAHLVGEFHADFLDGKEDLASTARTSVVWESETGQELEQWGQAAVRWAFKEWLRIRKEQKEEAIITVAGFDRWLKGRTRREQRVAKRMVSLLVDDPNIEKPSAENLLEIVKSSVETVAFRDLVDTMEEDGTTSATLLRLFDEWRIIEAREHLKLADGRMEVLEKLNRFVDEGALEVREMQPLFRENVWLLDSAWTEVEVEARYTKLLEQRFGESKRTLAKDRRLDLFGISASGAATVVELKRPEKTLSRKDLGQIEDYVDWARNNLTATSGKSPRYTRGLLVVGKLSSRGEVQDKMGRLAGDDITVTTYSDLHAKAREYYAEVDRRLREVAPEYARSRRKASARAAMVIVPAT